MSLPSHIIAFLAQFQPLFSAPIWRKVVVLLIGTLLTQLQVDLIWTAYPLPSHFHIARLLKAEKLKRRYQMHSELPTPAIEPHRMTSGN
jgi:hypothetical protein